VLEDLPSGSEIKRLTENLLRRADVVGRLPTPVDDLLAAAKLVEPANGFLTPGAIAEAPAHLRAVLRAVSRKVHAVLDRKTREVHLNPQTDYTGQGAFKRLHEVSHELFYWQHADGGSERPGFADDAFTLSPRVTALFEREANQGAAELLFQRDEFARAAADYRVSFAAIVELAQLYGSSIHAAFRRYVESHRYEVAGVVLGPKPAQYEPLGFCRREAVCSTSWRERFDDPASWPRTLIVSPYGFVGEAQRAAGLGAPAGTWRYVDRDNQPVDLRVEAFHNTYNTFVLLWRPRREAFKHRRQLAEAA
jgi:hypothetical protein